MRFFQQVPLLDFLFGLSWSPQTAIRADQVGSSGAFGAVPLFAGTLLISGLAMLVAVPVGLMSAIYLSEYASRRFRSYAKPLLEILAGIPTVVYGYFAALTVAPLLRGIGESIGLDVASESALGAGLVMGIMIIPFVSSLSDDVITAVPQALRDGSYGLGRHAFRDDSQRRVSGRAARHRRRRAAGGVARHRRDDDRRHGGRACRESDGESARSGDDGNGADRHAARRRPGVRQPEDARGVRARARAVPRHAGAEHHRAARRAPLPGAV